MADLTGLSVLIGTEMNAAIEHAAPHAVAAGAPVPGVRTVIGARAARKFRVRRRDRIQPLTAATRPREIAPAVKVGRAGALMAALRASLFGRRTTK